MSSTIKLPFSPEDIRANTAREMEAALQSPDDIVGHKTLKGGAQIPLRRAEAETIMAACDAKQAKRAADMPDEAAALNVMHDGYTRLRELGWRKAIYCPKDGTPFQSIEAGSTGVFRTHYTGEWPTGSWWVEDDGDLWPARPSLFKLYPEEQAAYDARMAEARARYLAATPEQN